MAMPVLWDIGLDENGDIPEISRFVSGAELVAQRLARRLRIQPNEWIVNRFQGLPWRDWSQVKPPPLLEIQSLVREEIATCPGVRSVTSCTATYDPTRYAVDVVAVAVLEDESTLTATGTSAPGNGNRSPLVWVVRQNRGGGAFAPIWPG